MGASGGCSSNCGILSPHLKKEDWGGGRLRTQLMAPLTDHTSHNYNDNDKDTDKDKTQRQPQRLERGEAEDPTHGPPTDHTSHKYTYNDKDKGKDLRVGTGRLRVQLMSTPGHIIMNSSGSRIPCTLQWSYNFDFVSWSYSLHLVLVM